MLAIRLDFDRHTTPELCAECGAVPPIHDSILCQPCLDMFMRPHDADSFGRTFDLTLLVW